MTRSVGIVASNEYVEQLKKHLHDAPDDGVVQTCEIGELSFRVISEPDYRTRLAQAIAIAYSDGSVWFEGKDGALRLITREDVVEAMDACDGREVANERS